MVSICWSMTVSPPHGDLVLPGVSIGASANLDILGVKIDRNLTFEDYVRDIVSRGSQRIGILRLVKLIFEHTSVLLPCYFAFVLPILEYCSPVWGSAAECHRQLLERQVYSVASLCPDQSFLSLCHRLRVAGLSMLYKVNSNSNHCLFSELPSAYTGVRHNRAAAAAHPQYHRTGGDRTVPQNRWWPNSTTEQVVTEQYHRTGGDRTIPQNRWWPNSTTEQVMPEVCQSEMIFTSLDMKLSYFKFMWYEIYWWGFVTNDINNMV